MFLTVFVTLADLIVAADARTAGLDKHPRFTAMQTRLAARGDARKRDLLIETYYMLQGLDIDAAVIRDIDVVQEYQWYATKLNTRGTQQDVELREEIRQRMQQTKLDGMREGHLIALRAAAKIEYLIASP